MQIHHTRVETELRCPEPVIHGCAAQSQSRHQTEQAYCQYVRHIVAILRAESPEMFKASMRTYPVLKQQPWAAHECHDPMSVALASL